MSFFMDTTNLQDKPKGEKPMSRQSLYSMISSRAKEAVGRLIELLHSKNDNVAVGAAKVLLSKVVPDLKSTELSGLNSGDFKLIIKLVEDKKQQEDMK